MIFFLVAYFFAFYITILRLNKRKQTFDPFPRLKITRDGISFHSYFRHRLIIYDAIMMQIGDMVYLKRNNTLIIIQNVDQVMRFDNIIYFKALGEVKIYMNTKQIYRYFNIHISTPKIDFDLLKNRASQDILNNIFDINKSRHLNNYIKLIKMLNITFNKDKLILKTNKLHIPFTLVYKLNNKIKKLIIND